MRYPIVIIIAVIVVNACKRQDTLSSKGAILATGKWHMTSMIGIDTIDFLSSEKECARDDFYVFGRDHSYSLDEGSNKCSSDFPQRRAEGRWEFINNEKQLQFGISPFTGAPFIADILELSSTRLVLRIETLTYSYRSIN